MSEWRSCIVKRRTTFFNYEDDYDIAEINVKPVTDHQQDT